MLTYDQFKKLFPKAKQSQVTYDALVAAMYNYGLLSNAVVARFLGQLAHETCGFIYNYELGNQAYFKRYEGRKDLGNTQKGDGYKYRGRGYIQLTGRANYTTYSKKLGLDLVNNPDIVATPAIAAQVACQYYTDRHLQDKTSVRDITKAINGGHLGLEDRINLTNKILKGLEE